MAERPRRADARRNRERILQAAYEAFASDGRLVPLDDIARRAGVGAGTVYRNFPTKEALFEAVVTQRIEQIIREAQALADAVDPAEAFYGFLMRVVERAMYNHSLCDALATDLRTLDACGLTSSSPSPSTPCCAGRRPLARCAPTWTSTRSAPCWAARC